MRLCTTWPSTGFGQRLFRSVVRSGRLPLSPAGPPSRSSERTGGAARGCRLVRRDRCLAQSTCVRSQRHPAQSLASREQPTPVKKPSAPSSESRGADPNPPAIASTAAASFSIVLQAAVRCRPQSRAFPRTISFRQPVRISSDSLRRGLRRHLHSPKPFPCPERQIVKANDPFDQLSLMRNLVRHVAQPASSDSLRNGS